MPCRVGALERVGRSHERVGEGFQGGFSDGERGDCCVEVERRFGLCSSSTVICDMVLRGISWVLELWDRMMVVGCGLDVLVLR